MWNLLIPAVTSLLDKVIPDPQAKAAAQLKMLEMAQKGELAALDADMKLALGQLEVNKIEAGTDLYRGGWRPGCGWGKCCWSSLSIPITAYSTVGSGLIWYYGSSLTSYRQRNSNGIVDWYARLRWIENV